MLAPKRDGITYFLIDLHAPGVTVRSLRHITRTVDFHTGSPLQARRFATGSALAS